MNDPEVKPSLKLLKDLLRIFHIALMEYLGQITVTVSIHLVMWRITVSHILLKDLLLFHVKEKKKKLNIPSEAS